MDTQEMKIRKGQAYNLAILDAVNMDKANNPKYIYKKFLYYYQLAEIIQGSDLDIIQEVVDTKDFDKVMKMLNEVMQ